MIDTFITQRAAIAAATVQSRARRKAADMARSVSRRASIAASIELANTAMGLLFEALADVETYQGENYLINVSESGAILVPLPWGTRGRYKYSLPATEADRLRRHMMRLQNDDRTLIVWDEPTRQWLLIGPAVRLPRWWLNSGPTLNTWCL